VNYVASDDFPNLWKWEKTAGTLSKLMVNYSEGDSKQVYCRVIVVILEDWPYLEMHGNYNPKFTEDMHKSKLQFFLKKPNDLNFGPDYSLAYKWLEGVQDKVTTGCDCLWFLKDGTMKFSFLLWEIKVHLKL
jgi:hypothetical protein